MRCKSCNVDLPESYAACPLCGGKTSNDEPLIKDIRTAEYPKVKTEPYKRNPFPIFLVIWFIVALLSLLLSRFNVISDLTAGILICAVPMVWTVILRPILIKQLYPGNFVMMNVYSFSLLAVVYSKIINGSADKAITDYLPLCCLVVMTGLIIIIFLNIKECKRAASYPVLMIPAALIGLIAAFAVSGKISILWIAVLLISVLMIIVLFAAKPQQVKEELEAKFSLQKPISYYKNK